LILPWIGIALLYAAFYSRLTRNQMLETLGEDYIRTARAKGIGATGILWKHALKNVSIPLVTTIGLGVGKWVHKVGGALMLFTFGAILVLPWLTLANGSLPEYHPLRTEMPVFSLLTLLIGFQSRVFIII
jgi:peptide/nickel transport system permease protein